MNGRLKNRLVNFTCMSEVIIPSYLKKNDTIGIVCPSGFMQFEKMQACIKTLQQWGFRVKLGNITKNQSHYFSGTDKERLDDLQAMLDDAEVKAILCARGGYGLSRIIDDIDFTKFSQQPKWIIGYSDVTLLLSHVYNTLNIASLHSPMAAAFNDGNENNQYVLSLKNALMGEKYAYKNDKHNYNRTGNAEGILVGGNLALLVHAIGTASAISTKNKILFLEDIGEYKYNIDRMLMQLKRAGKLVDLSALIIGSFTDIKDTTVPFGQEINDIIFDKVKEYNYPVCFDFPVGHSKENYALKIGINHSLHVSAEGVVLNEL